MLDEIHEGRSPNGATDSVLEIRIYSDNRFMPIHQWLTVVRSARRSPIMDEIRFGALTSFPCVMIYKILYLKLLLRFIEFLSVVC